MKTLKAFGISCGVVLVVGGIVAMLALAYVWKPWVLFVLLALILVASITFLLKGD